MTWNMKMSTSADIFNTGENIVFFLKRLQPHSILFLSLPHALPCLLICLLTYSSRVNLEYVGRQIA